MPQPPSPATSDQIHAAVAGQTVVTQFLATARTHPDQVALRWKDGEGWGRLTFGEYADRAARVASGLTGLGIGPGDRVVLMMRNRPEFHLADMGALLCGATPVSIYNSSSPEQIAYLAGHSQALVAVVEDGGYLERFLEVRRELPGLRHLVVIEDGADLGGGDGVGAWADLLDHEPCDRDEAAARTQPDDLATVIYTSGTTGPPKGVTITHRNVCWTVESYRRLVPYETLGRRGISYLPMAHVAERLSSHYLAVEGGYEFTTCPDATQLVDYARAVRPQVLFGVPRVWEKIHAGVHAALAADPDKARRFAEGVAAAKPLALARSHRPLTADEEATLAFLDEVAFRQVRELVGLDQVDYALSGAAPIPVEVLEWFRAIGVPLSEIYGMSENTGPLTWEPHAVKPGTVGRPMPGVTIRLADDGEVLARGGNVFPGYLDDPAKTAEALDTEGWLHTGDLGVIDEDGYLRIVDRKKELLITAGGKNVSPANLEAALKLVPLVGQACAVGDQRPYVAALLVLDPEVAPAWARSRDIEFDSLADLAASEEVRAEVARGVDEAMEHFSQAEQVKRFVLLADEWLPDSEELTPTSKLKRRGVHAKYAEEIAHLYT